MQQWYVAKIATTTSGLAAMSEVELDGYLAGLEKRVSTTMVTVATTVGAMRTPV
jgi:hypothetical protein